MANVYDETVGRLRKEYQLDLSEVFDEDDLKTAFESMTTKTGTRPKSLKNLTDNKDIFFEKSTDEVQNQVTENFSNKINKVASVDVLIKVPDIASNVRDNKVLQDAVDLKANAFIEESTTGDQISRREKAREVVSDVEEFDKLVKQKKMELVFENVKKEIETFYIIEDLPLSKLANVLGGSGFTLTTSSARTIKEKVLAGQTINEADIEF